MIGHLCQKIQNDRASSRSKRATKMIEVENFCHQNDRSSHTSHPHNYYTFVTHRHSRVRVGQLVCGRFSNVLNKLRVLLLCFEQLLNKFESGFCGSSAWGLHALIELGTSTALRMEGRIGSRGFSVSRFLQCLRSLRCSDRQHLQCTQPVFGYISKLLQVSAPNALYRGICPSSFELETIGGLSQVPYVGAQS